MLTSAEQPESIAPGAVPDRLGVRRMLFKLERWRGSVGGADCVSSSLSGGSTKLTERPERPERPISDALFKIGSLSPSSSSSPGDERNEKAPDFAEKGDVMTFHQPLLWRGIATCCGLLRASSTV